MSVNGNVGNTGDLRSRIQVEIAAKRAAARNRTDAAIAWTPETVARLLSGERARCTNRAKGSWVACCPCHDDASPSLSVDVGRDGALLVICRAGCSQSDVVATLRDRGVSLAPPQTGQAATVDTSGNIPALQSRGFQITAVYDYPDEHGEVRYQNVRLELHREGKRIAKTFRQRRPNPAGGFIENLGSERRIPYRLPEINASTDEVHITEGEKDADRLASLGFTATSIKDPGTTDLTPLRNRSVIIHEDNDGPGRTAASKLSDALKSLAASVVVVSYPDAGEKGDVSDWLNKGHTCDDLVRRIEEARRSPPPKSVPAGPDMTIVRRVVAPAPKLDLAAFGPLGDWIERAAESKSAPVDYVAMAVLGAAAATIGASRWISPWPGWREPSILWIMIVGSPSAGKSPGMDAARAPLAEVEHAAAATWPDTQRQHNTASVVAEARRDEWESKVKEAIKVGRPAPAMPHEADEPDVPQMPRIVVGDATIEAVAAIIAGNPRGLILWKDEAAGWLANIGKYGEGDRAFWLECYGGRAHVVDRKKLAKPLQIEHLAVLILAGIQPDRFSSLLMTGDDDGMAARFLYSWPEPVPPRRPRHWADPVPVVRALGRLHALAFGTDPETLARQPITLPIASEVLDALQEWRERHHEQSQTATGLLASALGKVPGQALRLALVLELLRWAVGPDGVPEPECVSGEALGASLDLMEGYFKPMLTRVLGEAALPVGDRDAAVLAREIQQRRATRINVREVRRDWRLPGLREAEPLRRAIAALEEARWLLPLGGREGETPGRQRSDYAIDPRVHGGGA